MDELSCACTVLEIMDLYNPHIRIMESFAVVFLWKPEIKTDLLRFHDATGSLHEVVYRLRHGDSYVISDDKSILFEFSDILKNISHQLQLSANVIQLLNQGFNLVRARSANDVSTYFLFLTILGTVVLVPNTIGTVLGPVSPTQDIVKIALMFTLTAGALVLFLRRWIRRLKL